MTDCNHHQHNQSNLHFSYLLPYFSSFLFFLLIRSLIHYRNLQSCHGSRLSNVQMPFGLKRGTSSKPSGAPDCHRSRQNRTVWFLQLRVGLPVSVHFMCEHIFVTPFPMPVSSDDGSVVADDHNCLN
jgi:hypothetical protein